MSRTFDILTIIFLLPIFILLCILIYFLLFVETKGSVIYWSKRVGINNNTFFMPKFRTMKLQTPQLATHLLESPDLYVTFFGKFLRKYSLDEIPQIYSVLVGNMSLIGPRPALYNQDDLIKMRKKHGIDKMLPGITGWAQVNGRDELTLEKKVEYEIYYLQNKS